MPTVQTAVLEIKPLFHSASFHPAQISRAIHPSIPSNGNSSIGCAKVLKMPATPERKFRCERIQTVATASQMSVASSRLFNTIISSKNAPRRESADGRPGRRSKRSNSIYYDTTGRDIQHAR